MEELISTGEAAKILNLSPQRIWQLIRGKNIAGCRKVGTRFVIPAHSLTAYIEERTRLRLEKKMEKAKAKDEKKETTR